jgi:hypothetical protein
MLIMRVGLLMPKPDCALHCSHDACNSAQSMVMARTHTSAQAHGVYKYSRGSQTRPAKADAAAVYGDAR